MWKLIVILLAILVFFSFKLSGNDSIAFSESINQRLSVINPNKKKADMLSNFKWGIITNSLNYEKAKLLELKNDTLYFFTEDYYFGNITGKVFAGDITEINYVTATWKFPGAIIGGIGGLIGGAIIGVNSIPQGQGDYGGLGQLFGLLVGVVLGSSVGGTAGWFIGDMIEIHDRFKYDNFNLDERRLLIQNEIFIIDKQNLQKSIIIENSKKDLSEENRYNISNSNQIKDTIGFKSEKFGVKSHNYSSKYLGLEYNSSTNVEVMAGYLPFEQIGVEFGFSSPSGKTNLFLEGSYYFQNTDVEKHVVSIGISNINETAGFCCADKTAYHWVNLYALIGSYRYSFYGISLGAGFYYPFKTETDLNLSKTYLTLGYRYYF